jgi:hypothetical protein
MPISYAVRYLGGRIRIPLSMPDLCIERFRAKWIPVRIKKTRQNKKIERGRDSIQSERALGLAGVTEFQTKSPVRCRTGLFICDVDRSEALAVKAFSSEVDTGSHKENASKQKDRARS